MRYPDWTMCRKKTGFFPLFRLNGHITFTVLKRLTAAPSNRHCRYSRNSGPLPGGMWYYYSCLFTLMLVTVDEFLRERVFLSFYFPWFSLKDEWVSITGKGLRYHPSIFIQQFLAFQLLLLKSRLLPIGNQLF